MKLSHQYLKRNCSVRHSILLLEPKELTFFVVKDKGYYYALGSCISIIKQYHYYMRFETHSIIKQYHYSVTSVRFETQNAI